MSNAIHVTLPVVYPDADTPTHGVRSLSSLSRSLLPPLQGYAVATKHDWSEGEELPPDTDKDAVDVVAVYEKGDFFGERPIIEQEDRAATVTARGRLRSV